MRKSVALQEFLKDAKRNPFKYFEECNIREVREACLDGMQAVRFDRERAKWAEGRIRFLMDEGDIDMARGLMRVYAHQTCHDPGMLLQALDFSILWKVGIGVEEAEVVGAEP